MILPKLGRAADAPLPRTAAAGVEVVFGTRPGLSFHRGFDSVSGGFALFVSLNSE